MLTFDVKKAGSWYIAECPEIGLGITAKDVAAIEETAERAARARGYKGALIRQAEQQATSVGRVAAFFRTLSLALPILGDVPVFRRRSSSRKQRPPF
jgi:hypothetical protein